MPPTRILAVDDEPLNLAIIEEYLSEESYSIDTAADGERAWAALAGSMEPYDLIILDRMMPVLDGLALLKRLKADPRFVQVPVIMQTAAAAPDQVREGVAAGAYYYLTKPYEPETLCAVVRAAINDRRMLREARSRADSLDWSLSLLEGATFRFRTFDDASNLATLLAALCPNPQRVQFGLAELMVNAIEHGNLGITYREKTRLLMENQWQAEVGRRHALPQYREKIARIRCERDAEAIRFTIIDEGDGFDWDRYLDFDPERIFDPNGRGIAMAHRTAFSDIAYQGKGNTVVVTVPLNPA